MPPSLEMTHSRAETGNSHRLQHFFLDADEDAEWWGNSGTSKDVAQTRSRPLTLAAKRTNRERRALARLRDSEPVHEDGANRGERAERHPPSSQMHSTGVGGRSSDAKTTTTTAFTAQAPAVGAVADESRASEEVITQPQQQRCQQQQYLAQQQQSLAQQQQYLAQLGTSIATCSWQLANVQAQLGAWGASETLPEWQSPTEHSGATAPETTPNLVCSFHQQGRCWYRKACWYQHVDGGQEESGLSLEGCLSQQPIKGTSGFQAPPRRVPEAQEVCPPPRSPADLTRGERIQPAGSDLQGVRGYALWNSPRGPPRGG